MTTFDDRERGFEAKFAYDGEREFRAQARRNRQLGLWAAEMLGKTGDEIEAYVAEVVKSDFEEAGDEDVARKVSADLEGKVSAEDVRAKMGTLLAQAKEQLANNG